MSMSGENDESAAKGNTVQVFVGSIVDYADLTNAALADPLLATGAIGLDSMEYQLAELVLAHDPDASTLADIWSGSGSGTQEESEGSGLAIGTVTLENTTGTTIDVPVGGATVATASFLTYDVLGDVHSGNWIQGSNPASLGEYVVAPGQSITIQVEATAFGENYDVAANALASVSVGGLTVTSSTALTGGDTFLTGAQNNQDGFLTTIYGHYTTIFNSTGFYPAEAHVNVDDSHEWTASDVASWEGYVDHARSVGILNVAPILTDNNYANNLAQPFATSAWFAGYREAALYGGGLAFDLPPAYFLARDWDDYDQNVIEMIRWCEQNGLRSSVIISPYNDNGYDPNWASETTQMLTELKNENALPDQVDIENYRSGSTNMYDATYTDPNSINELALIVAQFGLNTPTPSEDGLEVTGTSSAQTTAIMTGVQQVQNDQTGGNFHPFAIMQVFEETPAASITVTVCDTSSLLSLSDGNTSSSAGPGGSVTFSGTASQVTSFVQDLVATASSGANGVAHLEVTITDANGDVTAASSPVYVGILAPEITGLAASATESGYLRTGDVMTWKISVSEGITVDGSPTLLLSNQQQASYQGQDSSGALIFSYTVWQNEVGSDVTARAILYNGASFTNAAGNSLDVDSLDPYLAGQAGFNIQTYYASVISVSDLGVQANPAGGSEVLFALGSDTVLTVLTAGAPTVTMSDGGTASYVGLTSSGQLEFVYALPEGESGAVTPTTFSSGGAVFQDATGQELWGSATLSAMAAAIPVNTTAALVLPGATTSSDELKLFVNEDAFDGNADFRITVNGTVLPEIFTTSDLHSAGQVQELDIYGHFTGASATTVTVTFLNDAYGGSASADRNLYVQSIALDGTSVSLEQELASTGSIATATFQPGGQAQPVVTSLSASATESGYLRAGDVMTWTVAVSSPVTVQGAPTLLLSDGEQAVYKGQNASGSLIFTDTVWQNEVVSNVTATTLQLNGAIIANAAGDALNPSSLTAYLQSQAGFNIQTYYTYITSVSNVGASTSSASVPEFTFTLGAGSPLTAVTAGAPTVTMSNGGVATYVGLTASGQLKFAYVLPENGSGAVTPTVFNANGAVFQNASGEALWGAATLSSIASPFNYNVADNNFVTAHASTFASMAIQMAAMANSFYTAPGNNTLLSIGADMGNVVVNGVSSTIDVLAGDGTTLSYHGSSTGVIAAGNGNDTVIASAGNDTIALGSGDNDIVLGTGSSTVYSAGTDSIVGGSAYDEIDISGTNTSVFGGYGTSGYTGNSMLVNDESGTNSIIFAATKGTLVYGSNDTDTTVVAFGDTVVYGGAKGDHLYAGNGATILLTGTTNGNILVANDGRYANGNFVKLDGGLATGNNQFWAGSGNSTLIGGSGQDTLVAGSGSTTMTGGTGTNDFLFFDVAGSAGGNTIITDFANVTGTSDTIYLEGYGAAAATTALNTSQQVGANTVLSLNDGTTITLASFTQGNLAGHIIGT